MSGDKMREIKQINIHGQLSIPIKIRKKLGLEPGDSCEFIVCKNGVFVKQVEKPITMQEIVERTEKDIKNGNTVVVSSEEELEELINGL